MKFIITTLILGLSQLAVAQNLSGTGYNPPRNSMTPSYSDTGYAGGTISETARVVPDNKPRYGICDDHGNCEIVEGEAATNPQEGQQWVPRQEVVIMQAAQRAEQQAMIAAPAQRAPASYMPAASAQ